MVAISNGVRKTWLVRLRLIKTPCRYCNQTSTQGGQGFMLIAQDSSATPQGDDAAAVPIANSNLTEFGSNSL